MCLNGRVSMKIFNVIIIFFCFSFYSLASVDVIGITINKDDKADVYHKYEIVSEENNKLILNPKDVQLDGVIDVMVALKDDKVKAVLLTLEKNRFDYFYKILKSKYKLVEEEIPYVGDRYALFDKDGIGIFLDSRHLSSNVFLSYMDKEYKNEIIKKKREQDKNKMEHDVNQL